jgi:hypothetical protein
MHDFLDRMAIGKANALRDRDRGGSAVQVVKTRYASRELEPEGWERTYSEALADWSHAKTEAIEQLRFELYGDQWEGL